MVRIPVACPHCQSEQVVKRGKTDTGKQRPRRLPRSQRGAARPGHAPQDGVG